MKNDKYKNKYRIPSARLQNWDYSQAGSYFITICTQDRNHYFGYIENEKMIYSPIGAVAFVLWFEIKNRYKNLTLGEFVIMPNHIHGVLTLTENVPLETSATLSLPSKTQPAIGKKRFQNQGKNSISSIIGGYKAAVSKYTNRLNLNFGWQTRFYDHIIRDETSFANISNYIINNPKNWKQDTFYKPLA